MSVFFAPCAKVAAGKRPTAAPVVASFTICLLVSDMSGPLLMARREAPARYNIWNISTLFFFISVTRNYSRTHSETILTFASVIR
ncbi:hypothetical protein CHELA20_10419 [Hyphomicrobiales bacterium]|nr:hypothetical protein CHELA20_10419 [Hyphomicrobiales bacterium]